VSLDPDGGLTVNLGPAESLLFAFDNVKAEEEWRPLPVAGIAMQTLEEKWTAEFRHCRDGSVIDVEMGRLTDLKDLPGYLNFSGTVI
jgi:hypothetical protein